MFPFTALTHPTSDIKHPTLLLHTSQGTRYIFGKVPEGLQRALGEQKMRVSKVDGVYLTGELNWETFGGLPGLILTISDQGKKDLKVYHGNNFLNYVVSTWRSFVFRFGINLSTNVIPHGATHSDQHFDIQSIVLRKHETSTHQAFAANLNYKLSQIVSKMFPNQTSDQATASDPRLSDPYIHVKLPTTGPVETSTCYSIQLHKTRGKFLIEKANELGIKKGPNFGKLASGKEITLEDGTIIKPEQVLSEDRFFEKVLIIDIPTTEYIPAAQSAIWGDNIGIVYHFLGDDVKPFEGSYLNFIKSFSPSVTHYVSHPDYCPDSIIFKGSADLTLKLKAIQYNHFNLPLSSEAKLSKNINDSNVNILRQGQIVNIECTPKSQRNEITLDESHVSIKTGWEESYKANIEDQIFESRVDKNTLLDMKSVSKSNVDINLDLKDQVETITFGTGSALPSKHRNVISTLVRIPFTKDGEGYYRSVLLDAGENTIGLMRRTLGSQNLKSYFEELRIIYLSHLHADHHLGIISIIKEWLKQNKLNNNKLYVITPWQYNHFVQEWIRYEPNTDYLGRLSYISCEDFLAGKRRSEVKQIEFDSFGENFYHEPSYVSTTINRDLIETMFADVGLESLKTCRAIHCDWSYSVSLVMKLNNEGTESFKFSYSGDTRPNFNRFADKIGLYSDLLIHEATLENELVAEAKKKRHSTINEAIEVSNRMRAKKLILTHFSQRYPHMPDISQQTKVNASYCFAFDSMINLFGDIGDQHAVMDILDKAFTSEMNEADNYIEN